MLSNLASYLGYQLAPAELEPDVAEDVQLSAVEEDEWLLVERQEGVSEAIGTASCALPGARPSAMQESWYLTPPPSFSSRGPVHMETSPLENLLIEHPSMSVYQKSGKMIRRKTSNSSRSASEEESPLRPTSEEGTPTRPGRNERLNKLPRSKYSKKTTTKRPPASSSDDAVSLPSASDDDSQENKEVKMKNFVKSPRRSITTVKGLAKKPSSRWPDTNSSSDEMISIPSNNEDDSPTLSSLVIQPFAPPKKLYSDVLRTKPKLTASAAEIGETTAPIPLPPPSPKSAPQAPINADSVQGAEATMLIEEPAGDKDRRRTVQTVTDQQRQNFLNRSAQKVT